MQLIQKLFAENRDLIAFHWLKNAFLEKKVAMWEEQGFLQIKHTYPYIFLHCGTSFDDRKMNEPILERELITLIGCMGIIYQI